MIVVVLRQCSLTEADTAQASGCLLWKDINVAPQLFLADGAF